MEKGCTRAPKSDDALSAQSLLADQVHSDDVTAR
jgi:hypothetical protein